MIFNGVKNILKQIKEKFITKDTDETAQNTIAQYQNDIARKQNALTSAYQAKMNELNADSTIALTDIEKQQISLEYAKSVASKMSTNSDSEQLMVKAGLMTAEQAETGATIEATVADINAAIASKKITIAEGQQIATTLGLDAAQIKASKSAMLLNGVLTALKAHPIIAIIGAVVTLGVVASKAGKIFVDQLNKAKEKALEANKAAQEALENTNSEISTSKGELSEINSKLNETKESLKELASIKSPTFTDKNEIDKLSMQNAQLEEQKTLLENNIKIKQKAAAYDASNVLNSSVEMSHTRINKDGTIGETEPKTLTYSEHADLTAYEFKNAYSYYEDALKNGDTEKQDVAKELIDTITRNSATLTSELTNLTNNFKDDEGNIISGYEDLYNSYTGMIYNIQSLTDPNMFLTIAKNIADKNNIDFDKVINTAFGYAYTGHFSTEFLDQDFIKALTDAGIDEDTINIIFKKKQEEYNLLVDKIDEKYDILSNPMSLGSALNAEDIKSSLKDYARNNPIEFQLVASYDNDFNLLDKYIEEEKVKANNNVDYVGDYILNAINRIYNEAKSKQEEIAKTSTGIFTLEDSEGNATAMGELSESLDKIQEAYSTLNSAITEFNTNGAISADTLQSIMTLGDNWIDYLSVENGQLNVNSDAIKELTKARLDDIRAQAQQNMVNSVLSIESAEDATEYLKSTHYDLGDAIDSVDKESAIKHINDLVEEGIITSFNADILKDEFEEAWNSVDETMNSVSLEPLDLFANEDLSGVASNLSVISSEVDKLQSSYSNLSNAVDEYNTYGAISVDTLQSILENGSQYLQYLFDEDGNFALNKKSLNELTAARLMDMKAQAQQNLLSQLDNITNEADATRVLAFNNLELADSIQRVTAAQLENKINSMDFLTASTRDELLNSTMAQYNNIDKLFNATCADLSTSINGAEEATKDATDKMIDHFNNVADAYQGMIDTITKNISNISSVVSLLESQGNVAGEDFYNSMITQTQKKKEIYENMYDSLSNELNKVVNSGAVTIGDSNWQSMYGQLQDIRGEIISCEADVEEFGNSIQQMHWDNLDRISNKFSDISDEIGNIIDLLDTEKVLGESGEWTNDATTAIGLQFNKYEEGQKIADLYKREIAQLTKEYKSGKYSEIEYQEKLSDLNDKQWEGIQMSEEAKDAVLELAQVRADEMCDAIDDEVEKHNELIDKMKEELDLQDEQKQYAEDLADSQNEVDRIQRQLDALGNNNTAEGVKKREQLLAELAEANKDLADVQYDYYLDKQKDSLDQQQEDYEEAAEDKKDTINESLKDHEKVLKELSEYAKANAQTVFNTLTSLSKTHGITVSDTLTNAWASGSNAIDVYGTKLSQSKSIFKQNLDEIKGYFDGIINKANEVDNAIINAFNLDNGNIMSTINQIAGNFDSIVAAADAANASVTNLNSSIGNVDLTKLNSTPKAQVPEVKKYRIVEGFGSSKKVVEDSFTSLQEATNKMTKLQAQNRFNLGKFMVESYATGGTIGGKTDPFLQRAIGEGTLVAAKPDEGILTKVQNDAWLDLVPNLVNVSDAFKKFTLKDFSNAIVGGKGVTVDSPIVTINVDGDATNDTINKFKNVAQDVVSKQFNVLAQKIYNKGVR